MVYSSQSKMTGYACPFEFAFFKMTVHGEPPSGHVALYVDSAVIPWVRAMIDVDTVLCDNVLLKLCTSCYFKSKLLASYFIFYRKKRTLKTLMTVIVKLVFQVAISSSFKVEQVQQRQKKWLWDSIMSLLKHHHMVSHVKYVTFLPVIPSKLMCVVAKSFVPHALKSTHAQKFLIIIHVHIVIRYHLLIFLIWRSSAVLGTWRCIALTNHWVVSGLVNCDH